MDKQKELALQQELTAAGLDISSRDFLRAFHLAIDQQRPALYGASHREMSRAEVAAYEAGGFDLTPRETDGGGPLARSLAEFIAMIVESFSIETAAGLLGVGRSQVRRRIKEKTLYSFCRDSQILIPRFQFCHARTLPGLAKVLRELDPDAHPLSVFRFFMIPQVDLMLNVAEGEQQISPRDWLRLGLDPEAVARLARNLVLI